MPFPISGLTAQFAADNSGVKFENVVAESLLGKMHLNFSTEGLSWFQVDSALGDLESATVTLSDGDQK